MDWQHFDSPVDDSFCQFKHEAAEVRRPLVANRVPQQPLAVQHRLLKVSTALFEQARLSNSMACGVLASAIRRGPGRPGAVKWH